jgi:transposase
MTQRLLVLDFSGMLSLEAVCFGMPDRLEQALRQSGLWGAGVDVERYWNDIVKPTWETGSTTHTPYAHLIAQCIPASRLPADDVRRCAERFVQTYLRASVIDPAWRPLFDMLRSREQVTPLVATDHYAEATDHIAQQIATMGWRAAALRTDDAGKTSAQTISTPNGDLLPSRAVLIANSADIGARKDSVLFWRRVQEGLADTPQEVLVVDDFGANENLLDFYADPGKVNRRQAQTIDAIRSVFGAPVQAFPFILDRPLPAENALRAAYRAKVEAMVGKVIVTEQR